MFPFEATFSRGFFFGTFPLTPLLVNRFQVMISVKILVLMLESNLYSPPHIESWQWYSKNFFRPIALAQVDLRAVSLLMAVFFSWDPRSFSPLFLSFSLPILIAETKCTCLDSGGSASRRLGLFAFYPSSSSFPSDLLSQFLPAVLRSFAAPLSAVLSLLPNLPKIYFLESFAEDVSTGPSNPSLLCLSP